MDERHSLLSGGGDWDKDQVAREEVTLCLEEVGWASPCPEQTSLQ